MAKSDQSRAGNNSFSWEDGAVNTRPISAEGLNSGIRSDTQAAYLRGPTQQNYVGMSNATRDRMTNLTGAALQNRGLLTDSINYNRDVMSRGGMNEHQVGAMNGLQGTIGGLQEIVGNRGFNSQMADGLAGQQNAMRNFEGMANAGGWNDTMRGARDNYTGILNRYEGIADSGGLTPEQRQAMTGVQSTRARYDDLYKRGAAGNPELDANIKRTNDNTYADVMASLGSTGAVGSSIHMNELGGALANNESQLRYQDYGDSFNRQGSALAGAMGADNSLFGMGQTGMGNTQAALAGMAGANAGIAGLGQNAQTNLHNSIAGMGSTAGNIAGLGQQAMGNMTGALSGIQNANTGIFNMGQTGMANAANASGQLPGLYDQMMTPERLAVAEQGALDADAQQRAAFDPYLNHIAQYQGLLGANASGPQPAGLMDYLKLIGGTAAAVF